MDFNAWFTGFAALWSPLTFALLVGVSVGLVWVSLAPSQPALQVRARLDGYLARSDTVEAEELQQPFTVRALLPLLRSILRVFGALVPSRDLEATRRMLLQAGQPFGLTVLDFWGLRVLSVALVGGGYFFFMRAGLSEGVLLRNTLIAGVAGVFLLYYPFNEVSVFYWIWFRPGTFFVSAFWLLILYVVLDIVGLLGMPSGVAHVAHITGFGCGAAVATVLVLRGIVKPEQDERTLLETFGMRVPRIERQRPRSDYGPLVSRPLLPYLPTPPPDRPPVRPPGAVPPKSPDRPKPPAPPPRP